MTVTHPPLARRVATVTGPIQADTKAASMPTSWSTRREGWPMGEC